MCLAVRYDSDGNLPKPIRAKKDIHVIKALDIGDNNCLYSAFRGTEYKLNKLATVEELGITQSTQKHNGTEGKVSQGIHTFGSIAAYKHGYEKCVLSKRDNKMVPFHAVIPAGSLYLKGIFEGTKNCYVSTQLMVTGRVEGYCQFCYKSV